MNHICHFEMPVKDVEIKVAFYGKVFGWKTEKSGDYTFFLTPREPDGGLEPKAEAIILYIAVEDIGATLTTIESAGGKTVTPKTKIGGEHGFFALFNDPEGTLMGIWSER